VEVIDLNSKSAVFTARIERLRVSCRVAMLHSLPTVTLNMNKFDTFVLNKGKRESRNGNSIYRIKFRIQANLTSLDEQTAQS
jgi:hypothetical protein